VRDKGASLLAGAPGGPTEPEARRRLSEGLPLIVGLTRETTERLQDDLIGAGVIARLGPAPAGTPPLEAGSDPSGGGLRLAVAGALSVLFVAVWLLVTSSGERPAEAESPTAGQATTPKPAGLVEAPTPEPADLELSATIEPHWRTDYSLVGIVTARTALDSPADLELQLRDGPDGNLIHALHVAVSRSSREKRSVRFRKLLHEVGFSGGEKVWLIGIWGGLYSHPVALRVPPQGRR